MVVLLPRLCWFLALSVCLFSMTTQQGHGIITVVVVYCCHTFLRLKTTDNYWSILLCSTLTLPLVGDSFSAILKLPHWDSNVYLDLHLDSFQLPPIPHPKSSWCFTKLFKAYLARKAFSSDTCSNFPSKPFRNRTGCIFMILLFSHSDYEGHSIHPM